MNTPEYQRGYDAALEAIAAGDDPQESYNTAEEALNYNDFTRGWQQACREAGAKDAY